MLILDASGSMWGQLQGGITKIEIARDVMGQFFATRDASIPLGVVAYGHNRRGDCTDIEVIAPTGVQDPAALSQRLNGINPRGMTPISESLRVAAGQIPPTAEEADIILVTDGLETCDADPCAVAAQLAGEGIKIRAHVVGFGLTEQEAEALACVPDQTGGQLLRPQSGAELTAALNQIAAAEPAPEPVQEAFFDIGPKAEAGHTYLISYRGTAQPVDYAGFTRRGADAPDVSPSFGVIGGGSAANNPFSRQAPPEPGEYDLILHVTGQGVIARQPIEVVAASNGFDPVGTVEPDKRFAFTWRGPDQVEQRIVIARPGDPPATYQGDWGYALHKKGRMSLRAPAEPGIYELRYLSANRKEVLFFRAFGVGVPYDDADLTSSEDLAAQAAVATQAAPGQDDLPMVRATFRLPDGFPEVPLWWSAVPLDPGMSPEAWAPQTQMWVAEGTLEPGRYEVSTMGPGEVEFRGVVEIVPGQANDFVIPVFGPGDEDPAPTDHRSDAGPADPMNRMVTLMLPREVEGRRVQWSAVRRDRVMQDVAFAMSELRGDFTTEFADGRYEITGAGDGFAVKGEITVEPGGQTRFVIPLSTEQQAAESQGLDCRAGPCAYHDPVTRLALTLPGGWRITPPYYSETATGARATLPSATFSQPVGGIFQHFMLNPSDWNPVYGPCVEVSVGRLCRSAMGDIAYHRDFDMVRTSLRLEKAPGPQADALLEAGIDVAVMCDGPRHCDYHDPDTGLHMVVPAGWAMGEAFFVSATAGAIPLKNPRISFFRIGGSDAERFEFNPHQWLASNGPCESTLIGSVCHFLDAPESTRIAMMTAGLHARIDKRAAAAGDDVFAQKAGASID
ncbi:MAG: VWA domain-containing protein, partial [Rhizobiales bacterium]|nr:VWA domain-containing protein [Hyphomicrobiales bacterium]